MNAFRSNQDSLLPQPIFCEGQPEPARKMQAKRLYDLVLSGCGLVVLSPLFLALAALIKLADGGPVFYRQTRVGLGGQLFRIWKFRTMVPRAELVGPAVTRDGDARITRVGRFLRKTKLDELPQLWNVLKGEMSLVGPRPEVPHYMQHYTAEQRAVLRYRPGITDLASLQFRDEEMLLRQAGKLEEFYLEQCVPRKVKLNLEYAAKANLATDTWMILQTLCPYWVGVLAVYGCILAASFGLSALLLYNGALPTRLREHFLSELVAVVTLQLGALIWRKQYKGLVSYFGIPELRQVGTALAFACLLLLGLWAVANGGRSPCNLLVVDLLVSVVLLGGFRLLLRLWRERASEEDGAAMAHPVRVGIIGAGQSGSRLARELLGKQRRGRTVVAFFDDDCRRWHKNIHEVPVVGMPECLLEGWTEKLDEVIIAMPEASAERLRQIGHLLHQAGMPAYLAPSRLELWPE